MEIKGAIQLLKEYCLDMVGLALCSLTEKDGVDHEVREYKLLIGSNNLPSHNVESAIKHYCSQATRLYEPVYK